MSYVEHTWGPGKEAITNEKLNNIESGIVEALQSGGSGTATIRFSASGYNSSYHTFGYVFYAEYDDGDDRWVLNSDDTYNFIREGIYGYVAPQERFIVVPLSTDENVGVFVCSEADDTNVSGDISDTPVNVYTSYGSVYSNSYRVTGNCSVEFVAG